MAIVRWNPNRGTWLLDDFEKMFEDFLPTVAGERVSYPQLDLYEEEDKYVVKADLPGAAEKDIDVTFDNGVLTIKGTEKTKKMLRVKKKNSDVKPHKTLKNIQYSASSIHSFTAEIAERAEKINIMVKKKDHPFRCGAV